jgi:hypothetical protein
VPAVNGRFRPKNREVTKATRDPSAEIARSHSQGDRRAERADVSVERAGCARDQTGLANDGLTGGAGGVAASGSASDGMGGATSDTSGSMSSGGGGASGTGGSGSGEVFGDLELTGALTLSTNVLVQGDPISAQATIHNPSDSPIALNDLVINYFERAVTASSACRHSGARPTGETLPPACSPRWAARSTRSSSRGSTTAPAARSR